MDKSTGMSLVKALNNKARKAGVGAVRQIYVTVAEDVRTLVEFSTDEEQLDWLLMSELPNIRRGLGIIMEAVDEEDEKEYRKALSNAAALIADAVFGPSTYTQFRQMEQEILFWVRAQENKAKSKKEKTNGTK